MSALIIAQGEVHEGLNEWLAPVPDRRPGGGESRCLDGMPLVDVGIERDLPGPCDKQREAALAQSEPLLLRAPALREG